MRDTDFEDIREFLKHGSLDYWFEYLNHRVFSNSPFDTYHKLRHRLMISNGINDVAGAGSDGDANRIHFWHGLLHGLSIFLDRNVVDSFQIYTPAAKLGIEVGLELGYEQCRL